MNCITCSQHDIGRQRFERRGHLLHDVRREWQPRPQPGGLVPPHRGQHGGRIGWKELAFANGAMDS